MVVRAVLADAAFPRWKVDNPLPGRLDCPARQRSHAWVPWKSRPSSLRLFKPVALGDRIDGWRVRRRWIGGWDKCRVLFVVMVERPRRTRRSARRAANTFPLFVRP
jgi:hypothetical protein